MMFGKPETASGSRRGAVETARVPLGRVLIASVLALTLVGGSSPAFGTKPTAALLLNNQIESAVQASLTQVDSLIVRYESGKKPWRKLPLLGTKKVTAIPRNELSLGKFLGFQMYQVNFRTPVSSQVARRVAAQIMRSPSVEFAEPNGTVFIQTTGR